jgi:hypothetical protein
MGASKLSPAAMKVERRMRCEDGEKEAAETPDLRVLRQKVVGRRSGGGGRMSSPPRLLAPKSEEYEVKLLFGVRRGMYDEGGATS